MYKRQTFNDYQDADGCPDVTTPDADDDGIPDGLDQCPDEQEVWNWHVDHDGCPDALFAMNAVVIGVRRGDIRATVRILVVVERFCHQRARVAQIHDPVTVVVHDGCPDALFAMDADGDGIPDDTDVCIDQKERYNGYQDTDGCPDIPPYLTEKDTDGDGIIDGTDLSLIHI